MKHVTIEDLQVAHKQLQKASAELECGVERAVEKARREYLGSEKAQCQIQAIDIAVMREKSTLAKFNAQHKVTLAVDLAKVRKGKGFRPNDGWDLGGEVSIDYITENSIMVCPIGERGVITGVQLEDLKIERRES